jgi:hypothetical protein
MTIDPAAAAAQDHVVPISELQTQLRGQLGARADALRDLDRVLSLPQAREALAKANITNNQVQMAMARLSDEELSRLAEKARAAEQDVQGGLIVGLLALIGLVVVIIVVIAIVKRD